MKYPVSTKIIAAPPRWLRVVALGRAVQVGVVLRGGVSGRFGARGELLGNLRQLRERRLIARWRCDVIDHDVVWTDRQVYRVQRNQNASVKSKCKPLRA